MSRRDESAADVAVPAAAPVAPADIAVSAAGSAAGRLRAGARAGARGARRLAARLSFPLLPDDYTQLLNPLWSSRELRGRVVEVRREAADAATLVIRPGWGFELDYLPGQFVGIGVQLEGTWHWRSYSLTTPPRAADGLISVTVKAMPEGRLSSHLVEGLPVGTVVRLARPAGEFVLPSPPPPRMLLVTAGSGITPVIGMLRTLDRRGDLPDVLLVHSAPRPSDMLFRTELQALAERHPGLRVREWFTAETGRFVPGRHLVGLCPDWTERETWACGPAGLMDALEAHWSRSGLAGRLHVERFAPVTAPVTVPGGGVSGGPVSFALAGRSIDADGATPLLEAGEQAGVRLPFGCRMGICHTCVVRVRTGRVRDLRTGQERVVDGQSVQTCVTAAAGSCVIDA